MRWLIYMSRLIHLVVLVLTLVEYDATAAVVLFF